MSLDHPSLKRLACRLVTLALMATGLVVVAPPPAHAVADAVVSGTVVDSLTTQPLADVTVADASSGRTATTTVDGAYSLALPPGDHVLTATLAGYVPSSTPTLTLAAGQVLSTQGFTLAKYATASGTVTEKGTTTGIAGVVVKFFDATRNDPNPSVSATSGPGGSWSADLPPGTYVVQFDASQTDYLDRWFPGQGARAQAAPVTLIAGQGATLDDSLSRRPRILGTITASPGYLPLPGATVTATSRHGQVVSAITDAAGKFEIVGLVEDDYQVWVSRPGYVGTWLGYGNATIFPFSLTPGQVAEIQNVFLALGSTITGTAHVSGEPAVVLLGSDYRTVAADGSFSFVDVAPAPYITLIVWGHEPIETPISVVPGQSAVVDLTAIGGALDRQSVVGRVVDTSSAPIGGASVSISLASAVTAADGGFDLPVLGYDGYVQVTVGAPGYVTRTIIVEPQQVLGIVVLQRTTLLSGRVLLHPGDTPLANAVVEAFGTTGAVAMSTHTNSDGAYDLSGLAPGYYVVQASPIVGGGILTGCIGGAGNRAQASYVMVPEAAVLTNDILVMQPGRVSGILTRQGVPVGGSYVYLTGNKGGGSAITKPDGTFAITTVPGTYRFMVTTTTVTATLGGATVTEVTVPAAGDLSGYVIDLPALAPTFRLSGKVWQAGYVSPNQHIRVTNGTKSWDSWTGTNGTYTFSLAAGSYELGWVNDSGFVDWSPGSPGPVLVSLSADSVVDVTVPPERAIAVRLTGSDASVPTSAVVGVYNSHGEWFSGAEASSSGVATLAIPDGSFTVRVSAPGYLPWSSQVAVTADAELSATLDVGGSVAGALAGAPQRVTLINIRTGQRRSLTATGSYRMSGLDAGDYVVTAAALDDSMNVCGPATWLGGTSYVTATHLAVSSGFTADAPMSGACVAGWTWGGTISGHVTLPPSAPADALDSTDVVINGTYGTAASKWVGAGGAFVVSQLPPGVYDITALSWSLGATGHATVTVDSGSTARLVLPLVQLTTASGVVKGPLGEPITGWAATDGSAAEVVDGHFVLGLTPGTHTVTVGADAPYATSSVEVSVTAGHNITGLSVTLPLRSRLYGQLPTDLGLIEVTLTDAAGGVIDSQWASTGFLFADLAPGPLYVRFSGEGIVTEWWKDAPDRSSATPVVIPDGGGGITDISPFLSAARSGQGMTVISGRVTDSVGPVSGVAVGTYVGPNEVSAVTAEDGTYSLTVSRGDTYRVTARVCLGPDIWPCSGQFVWDGRDVVADAATVTGVDFAILDPRPVFAQSPPPVIAGCAYQGCTLTTSAPAWSPTPDVTSLQWYADGVPIAGADGTSLLLDRSLVGHVVTVEVTGVKDGYASRTVSSLATQMVEVSGAIHALTPSRLLDSRIGQGFTGPARNGTVITLPVWGQGGVPVGASAVLVNITVTEATAGGYLTAYASGTQAPLASSANLTQGVTAANLALVPVGSDGAIALTTALGGTVQVIVDVQGYVVGGTVTAAGAVVPVAPQRLLDSRSSHRVAAGSTVDLAVAGSGNVPADATAVVVNLTVTGPASSGYLTAYPTGESMPTASNVNFVTGQTVPNLAIVKVGSNGRISIYNAGSASMDMVVDVQGYVTAGTPELPGTVVPVSPTRVVDTRTGDGWYGQVPDGDGIVVDLDATNLTTPPQGALINLTATGATAGGWLAAFPPDEPLPLVSNVNFGANQDVPNMALATLTDGWCAIYNGGAGPVDVVVDVLAYVLA